MNKELHILNLGAGVQSTTLALLAARGELKDDAGNPIRFDCAIFADTMEEPEDPGYSVYDHLGWLETQLPFPIIRVSAGKLGDHLKHGTNSTGGKFVSIPAFTLGKNKKGKRKVSKVRRQCTKEYKIAPIEMAIRRNVLGLAPRKWIPRGLIVHHYIGISLDEAGRMLKAKKRQAEKPVKWAQFHYPLIENLGWTREDCRKFLKDIVPHRVPRSACVFCPFHDNAEWKSIKARGGRDWSRAVEIDEALRVEGNVVNRNMDQQMFLHRSCVPLKDIDFDSLGANAADDKSMAGECQGMCGN